MNKKLIIGIITGVVVIGALFTTFLIKNSSKNSQTLENTTTNNETTEVIEESDENTDTATQGSKVLVVYFSIPETDNPNNMTTEEANSTHVVDGQVLGNTQYVANLIQAQTKSDIYRIETAIDYPTEHRVLVDQAQQEQRSNARPEL